MVLSRRKTNVCEKGVKRKRARVVSTLRMLVWYGTILFVTYLHELTPGKPRRKDMDQIRCVAVLASIGVKILRRCCRLTFHLHISNFQYQLSLMTRSEVDLICDTSLGMPWVRQSVSRT